MYKASTTTADSRSLCLNINIRHSIREISCSSLFEVFTCKVNQRHLVIKFNIRRMESSVSSINLKLISSACLTIIKIISFNFNLSNILRVKYSFCLWMGGTNLSASISEVSSSTLGAHSCKTCTFCIISCKRSEKPRRLSIACVGISIVLSIYCWCCYSLANNISINHTRKYYHRSHSFIPCTYKV